MADRYFVNIGGMSYAELQALDIFQILAHCRYYCASSK